MFNVDGGVVTAGDARVHRRGERLGEHSDRVWRRVHPGGEAWMSVAERIGRDAGGEVVQHRVDGCAGRRDWLGGQALPQVGRVGPEHGLAR